MLGSGEQSRQQALEQFLADNLRPLSLLLGLLYLITAGLDLLMLSGSIRISMSIIALGTALLLLLMGALLRKNKRLLRQSEVLAVSLAGLLLGVSLSRILISGEIERSTSLMLLLIGIGFLFSSRKWFSLLLTATSLGWLGAVWLIRAWPESVHYAVAISASAVLATWINRTQLRMFFGFERLRQHEQDSRDQLADALVQVEQSEYRFRMLADAAFEGVAIHDRGALIDVNESLSQMLGIPHEQLMGMELLKFLADSNDPSTSLSLGSLPEEVTVSRPDASTFPAEIRERSIPLNGTELHVTAIRDLSGRRQLEAERERFFALSLDILCIADFDGYFRTLNPAAEQIFGYGKKELLAEPFLSFVHPDDQQSTIDAMGDLSSGANVIAFENRYRCKDGSYKWILWNATPSLEESLIYAVGRDITSRKEIEDQLALSYAALDAAANAVMITGQDGRISWVNPAFTRLTGYTLDEVRGETPSILRSGEHDEAFYNNLWQTISSGEVWQGDLVNRRKDGSLYFEEQTIAPVKGADGKILHYIGIKQDVTDRKQAEEASEDLREELRQANEQLEARVLERTQELNEAQQELLAQQRLRQDLEIAQEVQRSLLPGHLPRLNGFDFSTKAVPARYVSGDFYDFLPSDPEGCLTVIADIAGKGIPAALLTSTARSFIRAEHEPSRSPSQLLKQLNTSLIDDFKHAEMFITVLAAQLDQETGLVRYANAGHTEAIFWQAESGKCKKLPATAIPIGIENEFSPEELEIQLKPGDSLILYSDGVTEAINPKGDFYGSDRLSSVLSENFHLSADRIAKAINEDIEAFRENEAISDDLSLIVLKAVPRRVRFSYTASLDNLHSLAGGKVRQIAAPYGDSFAYELELAASEIATNIIQHAYQGGEGEIRGELRLYSHGIEVEMLDRGTTFDIEKVKVPDLGMEQEGGFGIFVSRKVTDELKYTPGQPSGNVWQLAKRIAKD